MLSYRNVAIVLLLVGGVAAYSFVQLQIKLDYIHEKYERTLGRVINYKNTDALKFYPIIGFITLDSQKIHFDAVAMSSTKRDLEIGEVVEIYYDLINPTDAQIVSTEKYWKNVSAICALAFLLLGGVVLIWDVRQGMKRRKLMNYGRKVSARILGINQLPDKGKASFVLNCQWTNEYGQSFHFTSEPYFQPIPQAVHEAEWVDLWIDQEVTTNYWVDFPSLIQKYQ